MRTVKSWNHIFEKVYSTAKYLCEENPILREDATALSEAVFRTNWPEYNFLELKPDTKIVDMGRYWTPMMFNTPGLPEKIYFNLEVLDVDGVQRYGLADMGEFESRKAIPGWIKEIRKNFVEEPISEVPLHDGADVNNFIKRYVPRKVGYDLWALHNVKIPEGVEIPRYCNLHQHDFEEVNHFWGENLVYEYRIRDLVLKVRGPAKVGIPMGEPHSQNVIGGNGLFEFQGYVSNQFSPVISYKNDIGKTITIPRPVRPNSTAASNVPDGYAMLEEQCKNLKIRRRELEQKHENSSMPIKLNQYAGHAYLYVL